MEPIKLELYDGLRKFYDDCKTLSELDQLKYESLEKDLAKADRLFKIFEGSCNDLVEAILLLGTKDKRTEGRKDVVTERAKGLGHIIMKIGQSYQRKLDKTARSYDEQMDEKYKEFYMPMIKAIIDDRKKLKEARDSGDIFEFAKAFVSGAVPKDPKTQRKVLNQYDEILDKAYDLHKAVKGTYLDSKGLLSVLVKHRAAYKGNIGGKRGKINLEYNLMRMQRRKSGSPKTDNSQM